MPTWPKKMFAEVAIQVVGKLRGRLRLHFGHFWSRLGVVAVTEDKWSSLTHCLMLVSLAKKSGPTESDRLEPMVDFCTWSLDQV